MNRQQIIAELRRSAAKDRDPWFSVHIDALAAVMYWWRFDDSWMGEESSETQSTLFLFVACALEDEQ